MRRNVSSRNDPHILYPMNQLSNYDLLFDTDGQYSCRKEPGQQINLGLVQIIRAKLSTTHFHLRDCLFSPLLTGANLLAPTYQREPFPARTRVDKCDHGHWIFKLVALRHPRPCAIPTRRLARPTLGCAWILTKTVQALLLCHALCVWVRM